MVFAGKTKNRIPFLIPAALANFTFYSSQESGTNYQLSFEF